MSCSLLREPGGGREGGEPEMRHSNTYSSCFRTAHTFPSSFTVRVACLRLMDWSPSMVMSESAGEKDPFKLATTTAQRSTFPAHGQQSCHHQRVAERWMHRKRRSSDRAACSSSLSAQALAMQRTHTHVLSLRFKKTRQRLRLQHTHRHRWCSEGTTSINAPLQWPPYDSK